MAYDLPPDISEAAFHARMTAAREQLEALVCALGVDGLHAPRDAAGWSTLDHLAHVGVWEQSVADVLRGLPRHRALGVTSELLASNDFDAINAEIRAWTSQRSTDAQLALFRDGHANLMAAIEGVGWAGLLLPYDTYDPSSSGAVAGAPMLAEVWADGPIHFEVHGRWIRTLHGLVADEA